LSPSRKKWRFGTVTGRGKLQPSGFSQARGPFVVSGLPLRTICPSRMEISSPPSATTRLTNLTSARPPVGFAHICPTGGAPPPHIWSRLAPAGGLTTTMSPTSGAPTLRTAKRSPTPMVGVMLSDGAW
jgi:hypothetical protein